MSSSPSPTSTASSSPTAPPSPPSPPSPPASSRLSSSRANPHIPNGQVLQADSNLSHDVEDDWKDDEGYYAASFLYSPTLPSLPSLPSLSSLSSLPLPALKTLLTSLSQLPHASSSLSPLLPLLSTSSASLLLHAKSLSHFAHDWWNGRGGEGERVREVEERRRKGKRDEGGGGEGGGGEGGNLKDYIGFLSHLVKGKGMGAGEAVMSGQKVMVVEEHFGVWDEQERDIIRKIEEELQAAQRKEREREKAKDKEAQEERKRRDSEEDGLRRDRRSDRHHSISSSPLPSPSPPITPVPISHSHSHSSRSPLPRIVSPSSRPHSAQPSVGGRMGSARQMPNRPPSSTSRTSAPLHQPGYLNTITNVFIPSSPDAPLVTSSALPDPYFPSSTNNPRNAVRNTSRPDMRTSAATYYTADPSSYDASSSPASSEGSYDDAAPNSFPLQTGILAGSSPQPVSSLALPPYSTLHSSGTVYPALASDASARPPSATVDHSPLPLSSHTRLDSSSSLSEDGVEASSLSSPPLPSLRTGHQSCFTFARDSAQSSSAYGVPPSGSVDEFLPAVFTSSQAIRSFVGAPSTSSFDGISYAVQYSPVLPGPLASSTEQAILSHLPPPDFPRVSAGAHVSKASLSSQFIPAVSSTLYNGVYAVPTSVSMPPHLSLQADVVTDQNSAGPIAAPVPVYAVSILSPTSPSPPPAFPTSLQQQTVITCRPLSLSPTVDSSPLLTQPAVPHPAVLSASLHTTVATACPSVVPLAIQPAPSLPPTPSVPSPSPASSSSSAVDDSAPIVVAAADCSSDIPVAPPLDNIPCAPPLHSDIPLAPNIESDIPTPPPLVTSPSSSSPSSLPPPPTLASSSSSKRSSLKRLHWSKLKYDAVQHSVWDDIIHPQGEWRSEDVEQLIGLSELELKFSSVGMTKEKKEERKEEKGAGGVERKVAAEPIEPPPKPKPSVFGAIDTLRARNVEIAFSQLKMTAETIKDGLMLTSWEMPRDALLSFLQQLAMSVSPQSSPSTLPPSPLISLPFSLDQLDVLSRIVPTDEEVIRTLALPPSVPCGCVEQFFRVMCTLPRVKRRVDLISFLLSSPTDLLSLSSSLSVLHSAHHQILSSSSFKRFLRLTLTVGNTLNAGSSQGGAYGFQLSWIVELSQVKTRDGKETMMEVLVKANEKAGGESLLDELSTVKAAALIDIQSLTAQLNGMRGMIGLARREGTSLHESDRLRDLLQLWVAGVETAVRAVEAGHAQMIEEQAVLCRYLAEEEGKGEGLAVMSSLLDLYKKAKEEGMRKDKEREAKEKAKKRGKEVTLPQPQPNPLASVAPRVMRQPRPAGAGLRREKFVRPVQPQQLSMNEACVTANGDGVCEEKALDHKKKD